MFFKIGSLKKFAKFTRKHLCWSFSMKLQSTDVFLWILWNLQEHFLQTVSDGCFWKFEKCLSSTIFSQQLKLCLHLIYFYSCSFAPSMAKMSSSIFFSNVSLNDTSCRKKCIMRKLSWNSEKPSSHPDVSMVKDVPENFAKFLCQSLVFC